MIGAYGRIPRPVRSRYGGCDASPMEETLRASAQTHFQSNLSDRMVQYVAIGLCHAVSYEINAVLFQHAPNLLDILHIHAGNTDTTLDPAITVLNNFKLKRDTIQTKDDFPAQ